MLKQINNKQNSADFLSDFLTIKILIFVYKVTVKKPLCIISYCLFYYDKPHVHHIIMVAGTNYAFCQCQSPVENAEDYSKS